MKFQRELTEEERQEFSAMLEEIGAMQNKTAAFGGLRIQYMENQLKAHNILGEVRLAANSGDVQANATVLAAEQAIRKLQDNLTLLDSEEEVFIRRCYTKVRSIWGKIMPFGKEMELAAQENITQELRPHFRLKSEAEYLASQTDTARDITHAFRDNRVQGNLAGREWLGEGECVSSLHTLRTMVTAFLNEGDVVPSIAPFPGEDEEATPATV